MPEQIDLPLGVALSIVLQGLRIRLGRSLVTISGVLLGIAILTSAATTYLVKKGVREEDSIRGDVRRMSNFLEAELGTIEGKTIGMLAVDEMTEVERRLAGRISEDATHLVMPAEQSSSFAPILPGDKITSSGDALSTDAILIIGSAENSRQFLAGLAERGYTKPVAMTRMTRESATQEKKLYLVPLSADMSDAEIAAAAKEKRTARFRIFWILGVALLVTLMGITNAMLMSVTERFREIGTMKCLGATSRLVRRIFLIESLIIGVSGGVSGALLGAACSLAFYSVIYGPSMVAGSIDVGILLVSLLGAILAGVFLTVVSAIYPASVASSMIPATALRSNF